ncbi:MAG: hypothetical protein Q8L99_08485 [Polycyclovorans sp.]|nr:hypothetical protein [Polycyclovorans sp.]
MTARIVETARAPKAKRSRQQFALRVIKGGFQPADRWTLEALKKRPYHVGDVLLADLKKPRNPKFNNMVHALGDMCAENIEAFEGIGAHDVIKRCQIEGDIACDQIALILPGVGPVHYRVPRSINFADMEEGDFKLLYEAFCRYIAKKYWPDLSEHQVGQMAELFPEAA